MERPHSELSRRERQIMDVVYRRGHATAEDVRRELSHGLSDSAVRTMLRRMEEKGHLRHQEHGRRYVYYPTVPREVAKASAIERLVRTFFEGSVEQAATALLDWAGSELSASELDRLARLIERARSEGR